MNYYNEYDAKAAAWLRSLISAGLIPNGHVDDRSITDVQPRDLRGYTQCHFFAGIGGWSRALFLAGIPETMPVWTGSCPCQPFSSAGQRRGTEDERHLWPVFRDLIAECRPSIVFGEQVASADGRAWLDVVRADLEALGYAVGAADLCAAGIGAPHIRQRLYFVGMADAVREQRHRCGNERKRGWLEPAICRSPCGLAHADGFASHRAGCGAGYDGGQFKGADGVCRESDISPGGAREGDGFWRDADWLWCRDGRWRPVESGSSPLVNGVSGRVALLRGYGNAIVPQVAAEFMKAALLSRLDL